MSQILTKWIADNAITTPKLDSSSIFNMAGANIAGKIGINTSSPQDDIHVREGAGSAIPAIRLDKADGALGRPYRLTSDALGSFNVVDASSLATRMTITRAGLLGLDTTNPQAEVHVLTNASPARLALDTGASQFILKTDNTTGNFFISKTSGTGSFGIDGAGHIIGGAVLAGDTTVTGNLQVTQDTTVGGGLEVMGTVTVVNVQGIVSDKLVIEHATTDPAIRVDNTSTGTALSINNLSSAYALTINQGSVGIGSTQPANTLDVVGAATFKTTSAFSSPSIALTNSSPSSLNMFMYGASYPGPAQFGMSVQNVATIITGVTPLIVGTFSAQPLYLGTNDLTRVTVSSAGKVGIGSTQPINLLDVSNNNSGSSAFGVVSYTNPGPYGSSSWQSVSPSGGNAIGMSAYKDLPVQPYGIPMANLTAIEAAYSSALLIATSDSAPIYLATNTAIRMTIDPSGNLGIGTTPSFPFHFYSNAGSDVYAAFQNVNTTGGVAVRVEDGFGNIAGLYQFGLGETNPYGNIGLIGMSALVSQASSANGFLIETVNTAPLYFGTVNQVWMTLNSLGDVGIGSTRPDLQLNVASGGGQAIEGIDTYNSTSGLNTGSVLRFRRSKNNSLGTPGATIDGDELGRISFHGNNGAAFQNPVSYISSVQTGAATSLGGHLIFATAPNTGGPAVERVRIDEDVRGFVGIGSTQPIANIDITSNNATIREKTLFSTGSANLVLSNDLLFSGSDVQDIKISLSGSGTAPFTCYGIPVSGSVATILSETNFGSEAAPLFIGNAAGPPFNTYNGAIYFGVGGATGGSVAMVIDRTGKIGIGSTQPEAPLNISATSANSVQLDIAMYNSTPGAFTGSSIVLRRSLNDTIGVQTVTGSGDELGNISFYAAAGVASWTNRLAYISVLQSGVTTSTGGAITFGTTSSNTTPTEKVRIDPSGRVGIGTTAPRRSLDVNGTAIVSTGLGVGTTLPGGGLLSPSTTDIKTSMVFNTVDKGGLDFAVADQDYIIMTLGRPGFAGGPQIATLPTIASQPIGRVLIFKNYQNPGASANTVVTCSGGNTFDAQAGPPLTTITLAGNGKLMIVNNGTYWSILSQ